MRRPLAAALALVALAATAALAQPPGVAAPGAEREQAYVEALRREDPAIADRYVALRDARNAAIADVERASTRYSAGGDALRPVTLPQLRQARRRYAETSLALLDFLDARDRGTLTRLQDDVARLTRALDERGRGRAELEQLRRDN
jgi:hypothetical protein